MLRKSLTSLFCAAVLFVQTGNALALLRTSKTPTSEKKNAVKAKTETITVTGPNVKCHQWGFMEVQLKVTRTVTTDATGKKKVTAWKILSASDVTYPIFPDHTPKSIYINKQALPLLVYETMQLQMNAGSKLENISGATHTTVSWRESIQGAISKIMTP